MPDFKIPQISKESLFSSLPASWPEDLLSEIRREVASSNRKLIVLDDDPTGTQTVHDLPVLTTWDTQVLAEEFANDFPCFYILTNTRAFPTVEAVRINQEIAHNLTIAAAGREFVVLSRGDSTLRGHYPEETDAISSVLSTNKKETPPLLLVPYFEAGGRFTINDVHFVAENDHLIPAAETPFAKDAAFGYENSNLRAWVQEKTAGRIKAADVTSISLDDLRVSGPDAVKAKLLSLKPGSVCIANAASPRDLEVLAWASLQAEEAGCRLMYRTAASFVASRLGLSPIALWHPTPSPTEAQGGLIIVGSYVPKTTQQLDSLLNRINLVKVEIPVTDLLNPELREAVLNHALTQANASILAGRDVVIFTSRNFITGNGAESSLNIGNQVSQGLVELLCGIQTKPRFLIAKGGITSSDLATRALGVKRAMVLGQILPGIPVWELGLESKFPGLPYVVFPGNVGGPDSLVDVANKFSP
jgi:uncharacterized protein YgbK (DUF1537 family)